VLAGDLLDSFAPRPVEVGDGQLLEVNINNLPLCRQFPLVCLALPFQFFFFQIFLGCHESIPRLADWCCPCAVPGHVIASRVALQGIPDSLG